MGLGTSLSPLLQLLPKPLGLNVRVIELVAGEILASDGEGVAAPESVDRDATLPTDLGTDPAYAVPMPPPHHVPHALVWDDGFDDDNRRSPARGRELPAWMARWQIRAPRLPVSTR